jgi:uncharacterized membrane protein
MNYIKSFLIPAIVLLLLDSIYLFSSKNLFSKLIFKIQRTPLEINIPSTILCYILLVGGLWYFILKEKKSVFDAFIFGVVIYGVYETTSCALFKNWSSLIVIMDSLWGGILLALTTYLTYKLTK